MRNFLINNREELIARCKLKVAQRPKRAATESQLANGVPLFLEQLTRTLAAEEADETAESIRNSGPSGGDSSALSEMGLSAAAHGKALLHLGYTVDQVVHDYGDLCQAITDLAFERDAPFAIEKFRTLNRCLDNAIADAVTEFSFQRDTTIARRHSAKAKEHLGFLAHEHPPGGSFSCRPTPAATMEVFSMNAHLQRRLRCQRQLRGVQLSAK